MNKFAKFLMNLITIILIIVIVLLSIYAIQIVFLKKGFASVFGFSIFKIETGSMSGTMEIGDYIIIKLTNDVNKDDIITYKSENNNFITHRIIEKNNNEIITKGDYNNTEDSPISVNNVIGKVVFVFKNVEIWKKVFTTPIVLISVVTTLILYGLAFSYESEKHKKVVDKKYEQNK